jgi:dipeptide/tripeptide permease
MLKGHPKGLLVAFFENMGERFGYYTMIAIPTTMDGGFRLLLGDSQ